MLQGEKVVVCPGFQHQSNLGSSVSEKHGCFMSEAAEGRACKGERAKKVVSAMMLQGKRKEFLSEKTNLIVDSQLPNFVVMGPIRDDYYYFHCTHS